MDNKKTDIETPLLNFTKNDDWEYVYKPSEDTFLLLDALEQDLEYFQKKLPRTVLEVGSGAGMIITALSQILNSHSHCLAIDINQHACKLSKHTSIYNKTFVDVIQGDLMSCLKQEVVDMIVFNPPYVVTTSSEVYSNDVLTRSWAGGINGMEVTNRFLNMMPSILSKNGFGYLLVSKENQPNKIIEKIKNKQFDCSIIKIRKIRCEELLVLKFIKKECV